MRCPCSPTCSCRRRRRRRRRRRAHRHLPLPVRPPPPPPIGPPPTPARHCARPPRALRPGAVHSAPPLAGADPPIGPRRRPSRRSVKRRAAAGRCGGAGERGRGRAPRPAHSSRLGPPFARRGRGEARLPLRPRAPRGCQSRGGARRLGGLPPGSGGSKFGCALLKVLLLVPRPTSPAAAEKREERGALGPQRGPNPLLRRGGAAARFRRSANLFPLLFLLPQRSVSSGGEEDDPCLVRATPALLPLSFSVASEAQLPAPPPVPCVFLAPCLSRHGLRAQQGVFTCAHCPGSDAGGLHRGRRRGLGFAPCFSSPCPPTSSATLDFLPSAPGSRLTARRVQLPGLAEPWTLPGLRPRGVWA
ncbi:LOW QUALITY PROTEIN: uncharacterized protein [Macaca nemestrina]|uniref:LOW QUALITY PROTEIN: uncharacterized protein n=1 Tax=Macaca nemestrina TaxID=9545 RepID=UPI0039B868EA